MALFKTLKRAFGFGDSEVEDNGHEGIDARVKPLRKPDADEVADGENIAGRMHPQVRTVPMMPVPGQMRLICKSNRLCLRQFLKRL